MLRNQILGSCWIVLGALAIPLPASEIWRLGFRNPTATASDVLFIVFIALCMTSAYLLRRGNTFGRIAIGILAALLLLYLFVCLLFMGSLLSTPLVVLTGLIVLFLLFTIYTSFIASHAATHVA